MHCVVWSSIYGFWLPLWYLQTLLANHLSEKICLSELSYWCSIWKFRCPVNQSLKNDFSKSQVAASIWFNVLVFLLLDYCCRILESIWFTWVAEANHLPMNIEHDADQPWLKLQLAATCDVDRCLSFCTFSFGHCVVCSSIYGFWLPLWYLQTLLANHLSEKICLSELSYVTWTPLKSGYITNRFIGFNLRQIQDIIDYSNIYKIEGAIIF
jgi:hypothetical protein